MIRLKQYTPMIKKDGKYMTPTFWKGSFYNKKKLQKVKREIEESCPQYKGKIVFFEYVLKKLES
jgi:hypothetical protein